MARNRRSCFHSAHTKEDGGLQMFLGMCNDTTSRKAQEPSTGLFFDKMCHTVCYLQIYSYQFLQLIYSETNLLFQQLIDHAFAFKKKRRGGGRTDDTRKLIARAGWGVGWAGVEAHPLACFSSSNVCPGAAQPAHGPPHLPRPAPSNERRCERRKGNRKTNLKEGLNSWPCKYGICLLLLGSDSTQRASVCISSAVSWVAPHCTEAVPPREPWSLPC